MTPTVGGLLAAGVAALEGAGLPTARRDAEWLLAAVLGVERFPLCLDPRRAVSAEAAGEFRSRIERRTAQEPVQYIAGFDEFGGLRLKVGPGALIPRPETEIVVERALQLEREHGPWRVAVDVGTGTGAIACALAAAVPRLEVLAVERSVGALALAATNISTLGLGGRVRLVAGDLLEPLAGLAGAVDLVVSNPPYIPTGELGGLPTEVRDWEPREALDGGPDGMAVHRRLIAESRRFLRPGGWLLMEIGERQGRELRQVLEASGFGQIEARKDLRGVERIIGGRVPSTHAGYPRGTRGCVGAKAGVR